MTKRLPRLGQALHAGQITTYHAATIDAATAHLDNDAVARAVADEGITNATKGRTGTQPLSRLTKLITGLDLAGAKRRRDARVAYGSPSVRIRFSPG